MSLIPQSQPTMSVVHKQDKDDVFVQHDEDKVDDVLKPDVRGTTIEDRATALSIAQKADPGLKPGSWRSIQFTLIILVACTCSGDNGEWPA